MLEAQRGCQPKEAVEPSGHFAERPGHRARAESTFVLSRPLQTFLWIHSSPQTARPFLVPLVEYNISLHRLLKLCATEQVSPTQAGEAVGSEENSPFSSLSTCLSHSGRARLPWVESLGKKGEGELGFSHPCVALCPQVGRLQS